MNHENVIGLYDVFTPDINDSTLNDVFVFFNKIFGNELLFFSYFVTGLMGSDLSNILKIQRLSDDHIQFLVYQILRALKVYLLCL